MLKAFFYEQLHIQYLNTFSNLRIIFSVKYELLSILLREDVVVDGGGCSSLLQKYPVTGKRWRIWKCEIGIRFYTVSCKGSILNVVNRDEGHDIKEPGVLYKS